jgi:hypothetical protein
MYVMERFCGGAVGHSQDVGEIQTPAGAILVYWLQLGLEMYIQLVGQSV